jgi:O-antigen ligase
MLVHNRKQILKQLPFYGLIAIVITLPYSIQLNGIAIIMFAISCLLQKNLIDRIKQLKNHKLFFLFTAFYLLHVLSFFYSENKNAVLFDVERKLSLIIFPIFIGITRLSNSQINHILFAHILSCVFASTICIVYSFDHFVSFNDHILNHGFREKMTEAIGIHHVYFSIYISQAIFISITLYFRSYFNTLQWKLFFVFSTVFLLFMLGSLSARMPLIAFLLTSLSIAFLIIVITKKYKIGIISLIGVVCLSTILYNSPRIRYMIDISRNTSYNFDTPYNHEWSSGFSVRFAIWKCSADTFRRNNFFIGTGVGDIQDEMQKSYALNNFTFAYDNQFNNHNQFIETLMGLGTIGLLLLLSMLILPALISIKTEKLLYFSFLSLIFISFLTETVLNTQKGVVFFSFFNSLLYFHYLPTHEKE